MLRKSIRREFSSQTPWRFNRAFQRIYDECDPKQLLNRVCNWVKLLFGGIEVFEVTVEKNFSAAHHLRDYPGNCRNLHGHNWKVEVAFRVGELDAMGLAIDFRLAARLLDTVIAPLDHINLNDFPAFKSMNPTCENISRYIFKEIKKLLEDHPKPETRVYRVRVWESGTTHVAYMEDTQ